MMMPSEPAVRAQPDAPVVLGRDDCAAAVWDRPVPEGVTAWLDTLAPQRLPQGRLVARPRDVAAAVQGMCAHAGTPDGAARQAFVKDVARLATDFAAAMATDWLHLRLAAVTTNACRKFHVDALWARLVCTYRGTGTQYGLAAPGTDPKEIHTVATGVPILLRGTRWPAPQAASLLHRSPPIEGTGEVRLVLVLDPAASADG